MTLREAVFGCLADQIIATPDGLTDHYTVSQLPCCLEALDRRREIDNEFVNRYYRLGVPKAPNCGSGGQYKPRYLYLPC